MRVSFSLGPPGSCGVRDGGRELLVSGVGGVSEAQQSMRVAVMHRACPAGVWLANMCTQACC